MKRFNTYFLILFFVTLLFSCKNDPKIDTEKAIELKFEISQSLRRKVASNLVLGDSIDPFLQNFTNVDYFDFKPKKYIARLNENKGISTCGLAASILVKLLNQKGIEAYTYNFGFNEKLSHVVTLAKIQNYPPKWIVQDPHYNYTIVDSLSKPKDFFEMLKELKNKNLSNITIIEDTLFRKQIFKKSTSNAIETVIPEPCLSYINSLTVVNKQKSFLKNCYTCLDTIDCENINFKKKIVRKLKQKHLPPNFLYSYLLQIHQLWGPSPIKLQKEIDKVIHASD